MKDLLIVRKGKEQRGMWSPRQKFPLKATVKDSAISGVHQIHNLGGDVVIFEASEV